MSTHAHSSPCQLISWVFLVVCVCALGALVLHDHVAAHKAQSSRLAQPYPREMLQKPNLFPTDLEPTAPKPATRQAATPKAIATSSKPPYTPDFQIPLATDGLAPVITHVDTQQPVIFLGIDDGVFQDPSVVTLMKKHNVKASLFLSNMLIASNPQFFTQLTAQGSTVQNHTLHHDIHMSKQSYAYQRTEICGMADIIEQYYGKRPLFFRPPGGAYSDTMRRAAHDCGMKAVVTWIAKANGGSMQYQVGNTLRPGDIVLMHFRPEFKHDLEAFIHAQNEAGLRTELLDAAYSPAEE